MNTNLPPILDFDESSNRGTLFDTRDGQSYPVVKIGKQIWLAENFRYLPSLEKGDKYCHSWVYDNDNSYLEKGYGRLYDWNTAMSIAPEGWKLPTSEDFQELKDFIIKDNNLDKNENKVGSYLKSIEGWNSSFRNIKPNNDKYGFNAKPAGYYNSRNDYFSSNGYYANFWSTMNKNMGSNNQWYLYFNDRAFRNLTSNSFMKYGFSVRLIEDYDKKKQS